METFLAPLYEGLAASFPFEWAQFAFMWRAVLAIMVIAPLCALMGVHVVNFRMAFFSDAISHSTFAGVALGFLFGLEPLGMRGATGLLLFTLLMSGALRAPGWRRRSGRAHG